MSQKQQAIITIGLLTLILLVVALFLFKMVFNKEDNYKESPAYSALSTPDGVPSFTDLEGNDIQISETVEKTVIIYSWASWCPSCKSELQQLDSYAATLDKETVQVYAINRKEDERAAKRFLNTLPELRNIEIILDPSDHLFTSVSGYAVPEILVYDSEGELVLHDRSILRTANIEAIVQSKKES